MYLNELNEKQLLAVKQTEGYVRVVAGAGTGKTRVLTSRFLYLVNELGIDSDSILCMTFTRKAMNEMKRRIKNVLGEDHSLKYVNTYHSFGSMFLKEEIPVLLYPKSFRIFDEDDQKKVIRKILEKYDTEYDPSLFDDIKDGIKKVKQDCKYIDRIMNRKYPDHVLEKVNTKFDIIIDEYLLAQRKNKWLDFDDLILFTYHILKNYPEIREKWQDRFSYVEVDEAQDTSKIENDIIEMLSDKCHNLFVVGDPDQNIYEWRDSDNRILLDFDKRHKGAMTFILNDNYRSTNEIIDASNNLIKNNKNRVEKDLISIKGKGQEVKYQSLENEEGVASDIIALLADSKERGETLKDNAILYRCQFQSMSLENVLKRNKIPYRVVGELSFYSLMEVKDAIALIKIYCFEDDQSFVRMVNRPSRKFGKKKLDLLLLLQKEESLFKTLKKYRNQEEFVDNEALSFVSTIDFIREHEAEWGLKKTVIHLFDDTGYSDYIFNMKNENRSENLKVLSNMIFEYAHDHPHATLKECYHALLEDNDEDFEDRDRLELMTIHSAKGLEFKNVYVVGLNDGILPHEKTLEERGDNGLEEERRLLYVAMTRAKDRLYLYSNVVGSFGDVKPSRFIKEIFPTMEEVTYVSSDNEEKPKKKTAKKTRTTKKSKEDDFDPKEIEKQDSVLAGMFKKFREDKK